MNSIEYPDMFTSSSTKVVTGIDASTQDLLLLLSSEQGELLGDPFFGVKLKRFYYDQNNSVLRDIIADEMLDQIKVFAPQLTVTRKDITVSSEGHRLYAFIRAINNIDFTTNMYRLELFNADER